MGAQKVTTFRRASLEPGQKVRLLDGPRGGDWLVLGVDDRKMRLRCPVSGREVEWDRFTAEEGTILAEVWPAKGPLLGTPLSSAPAAGKEEAGLLYAMLFDQSPLSIAIHQGGNFVLVNPATLKLLGAKAPEQLVGRPILDIVHPEDRANVMERVRLMSQGKPVPRVEERFVRLDGSVFVGEATAAPITYEGKPAFLVMVSDITERKNLAHALARAQELAHLGSWTYDPSEKRTTWSPELYRIFGVAPEAFDPSTPDFVNAIHPADVERARRDLAVSHKGHTPFDTTFRIVRPNGDSRHLSVRGEWGSDAHSASPLFMGTALDVTDKALLEAELRQAQKMEALGTLAGGVAHDFNNVLSAVLGYAELSFGQAVEGSAQQKYLTEVLKAGRRARDLVRQILAFSRKTDEKKGPVNVAEVVFETLDMLRATIPATIDIERSAPKVPSYTWGSSSQLGQVVTNLVTNAYQAVKSAGGKIKVQVTPCTIPAKRQLTVGEVAEGEYLLLCVTDDGEGIPEQLLEKIFDPFFTTKEIGEGTGLGLSVVHGIVSAMGGGIEVTSRRGGGTTFAVFMPSSAPALAEEGRRAVSDSAAPKGLRILVVDDERALAELGQTLLTTMGFKVEMAFSAQEALKLIGEKPGRFDLIISDQTMPGMTGLQLLRKVKTIDPALGTILCTGFSEAVNEQALMEAHVGRLLMKPFSRDMLGKAIAEAVKTPPLND